MRYNKALSTFTTRTLHSMNNYSITRPFLSLSHKGLFIYLSVLASLMNLAVYRMRGIDYRVMYEYGKNSDWKY